MADDGAANAHTVFRVLQVLTLIPAWALLSAVLAAYNEADQETPGGIITLFVGCLLGSIWSFCVLIVANRARNTALWMTFWDIVAMGVLIAGVATTSNIANVNCGNNVQSSSIVYLAPDGTPIRSEDVNSSTITVNNGEDNDAIWRNQDNCNLIKAAWGLAIANIIMYFITAILAAVIWKQNRESAANTAIIVEEEPVPPPVVREKVYTEDYDEYPRRPHRSRRHPRESSRDYERGYEHTSRSSRRASRSSRPRSAHRSSRSVPAGDDYV
jgi:hypothetical protein